MSTPRLTDAPVATPRALRRRWADVLEPPFFSSRSLWVMWLQADGTAVPLVAPIDDLPRRLDAVVARGVLDLATTVRTEQTTDAGHVAFALCRPGHATCTGSDQEWADGLARAAERTGLADWSLHLAAGGAVVPLVAPPWPSPQHTG